MDKRSEQTDLGSLFTSNLQIAGRDIAKGFIERVFREAAVMVHLQVSEPFAEKLRAAKELLLTP